MYKISICYDSYHDHPVIGYVKSGVGMHKLWKQFFVFFC